METLLDFICLHAHQAHWIIFSLLMLAGLNLPISEDLLLITGGAIASTCIPNEAFHLYLWILIGCWISAWETYWIGRLLGPKLYRINWFNRVITPKRIEKLNHYYERFGIYTFIVGRFIPGGVRNALFITTGLAQMPFYKFMIRDGLACFISTTTIFLIGYLFGENYQTIFHYFKAYDKMVISCMILLVFSFGGILFWRRRTI